MTGRILLLGLLLVCVVGGIKALESCSPDESSNICPMNYDPICGSDGITHPNRCALCSKNPPVQIAHNGPCNA